MTLLCGVDGCRGGWVVVSRDFGSGKISCRVVQRLQELIVDSSVPEVIAVDVPIGLPEVGARPCDLEARRMLGRGRASSVFPAPIRPVLAATCHAEASAIRREVEGKGMSLQAWAIVPKIREIDDALRADPALQMRVREVHPEICFHFLAGGRPMRFSKRKRDGGVERMELLRGEFGPAVDEVISGRPRATCGTDDILDAFAALWTAQRIMTAKAVTLPASPGHDRHGLPMEMVA